MAETKDCVFWDKSIFWNGYGQIKRNGRVQNAHRYFYEQKFGLIPKGLVIDHLCRNRSCINVDHLEAVTVAENTRRGNSAKLNYKIIEKIKNMYKKGIIQKEIAKLFGVGQDEISRIVNRKRWS